MSLTTVQNGMIGTVNSLTDSSGAVYGGLYGFKNRIINGAMMIDQRNAGASFSNVDSAFCLDRWKLASYDGSAQTGKFTVQQNAGSVTPPVGYVNYLGVTSSAATTGSSTAIYYVGQPVEGLNVSDLAWGTASAVSVTLSFWVRSSLTGTFGGAITNSAQNYSYPFTFTISSANTWEQKTVTIAGATSGTWLTTNGIGLRLIFNLGTGSTYTGTAGSWSANTYLNATGSTNVVATNGATFYITGVQLEKGSTATSFDYRPYGTELQLCQRYCQVYTNSDTANQRHSTTGWATGTTNVDASFLFKATMRTSASVSIDTIGNLRLSDGAAASTPSSYAILGAVTNSNQALVAFGGSGLTTFRPYWVEGNGVMNTAKITFSAEL